VFIKYFPLKPRDCRDNKAKEEKWEIDICEECIGWLSYPLSYGFTKIKENWEEPSEYKILPKYFSGIQ